MVPDTPTPKFGEALRSQVEERLKFFETGEPPSKNAEAIQKVLADLADTMDVDDEDDAEDDVKMGGLEKIEVIPEKKKPKKVSSRPVVIIVCAGG